MTLSIGQMYWDLTEAAYAVYRMLKKDSYLMSRINAEKGSKKIIRRAVTITAINAKREEIIEKALTSQECQQIINLVSAMTIKPKTITI